MILLKNRKSLLKNKLVADLCGCEVYWAANYSSCLYDFIQAQPTLNDTDFLKFLKITYCLHCQNKMPKIF